MTRRGKVVAVMVVIAGFTATDYVRFERICGRVSALSSQFEGKVGSVGGWPIGREYVIRIEHPLSEADVSHLVEIVSGSSRFHVTVWFSCEVPASSLSSMRELTAGQPIRIVCDRARTK